MAQIEQTDIDNKNWEKKTIEKLLFETLKEQRRKRRWRIFFRAIYLLIIISIIALLMPEKKLSSAGRLKEHIALVQISGEISSSSAANADDIIDSLHQAFNDPNSGGVIMEINSPGGSAAQATEIFNEIMYLRQKHKNVKIYAACSDMCTSAAYYIAAAANGIYANPASLVGSIGVMIDGFGFVDVMKKVGVERRLLTAGSEKGFLDPFSPLKPGDAEFAHNMLESVHQQFIANVKKGRGDRLKENPQLFSGLAWTGAEALQFGLVDELGSARDVARNIFKNTNVVDYTQKPTIFEQVSNSFGSSFLHQLVNEFSQKGIQF